MGRRTRTNSRQSRIGISPIVVKISSTQATVTNPPTIQVPIRNPTIRAPTIPSMNSVKIQVPTTQAQEVVSFGNPYDNKRLLIPSGSMSAKQQVIAKQNRIPTFESFLPRINTYIHHLKTKHSELKGESYAPGLYGLYLQEVVYEKVPEEIKEVMAISKDYKKNILEIIRHADYEFLWKKYKHHVPIENIFKEFGSLFVIHGYTLTTFEAFYAQWETQFRKYMSIDASPEEPDTWTLTKLIKAPFRSYPFLESAMNEIPKENVEAYALKMYNYIKKNM